MGLSSLRYLIQYKFGSDASSNYLAGAYWEGSLAGLYDLSIRNTYILFDFSFSPVTLPILLLVGLGLRHYVRDTPFRLLIRFTLLTFCIFLLAALSGLYPYSGHRQVIVLSPFLYLLAGKGIEMLQLFYNKRLVGVVILPLLLLSGIRSYQVLEWTGFENFEPIAKALINNARPSDGIWIYGEDTHQMKYYLRDFDRRINYSSSFRGDPERYMTSLKTNLLSHKRCWVVLGRCYKNECNYITDSLSSMPGYRARLFQESKDVNLYLVQSMNLSGSISTSPGEASSRNAPAE